jgi:hypothetical protein
MLRPFEDGVSESVLVAGEKRLGLPLPPILRAFYGLAGNLSRINRVQELLLPPVNPNRLPRNYDELRAFFRAAGKPEPQLSPDNTIRFPLSYDELTTAGDALAVYIENQGGCLWGIECAALAQPDPPVSIALDIDQPVWQPFHDCLSGFLVAMFYHQAVHLGLRYGGVAKATATLVKRVKRNWPVVARFGNVCAAFEPDGSEPEEFYSRPGQILSFRDRNLWVCTRTEGDREAVRHDLGTRWKMRFPEDFPPINSALVDGWEE